MALSSRDKRALTVLGGVVVVGGAALAFLMSRGDGQGSTVTSARPPVVVEAPEPVVGPRRPPKFAMFGGRDPFVPLVVAAAGGGGAGTSSAGVTSVSEPGSSGGTVVGGHTVVLVDVVDSNTAQVSVDGTSYTVNEGQQFAGNFELVSVSGACANLLFGDQAFTLCETSLK